MPSNPLQLLGLPILCELIDLDACSSQKNSHFSIECSENNGNVAYLIQLDRKINLCFDSTVSMLKRATVRLIHCRMLLPNNFVLASNITSNYCDASRYRIGWVSWPELYSSVANSGSTFAIEWIGCVVDQRVVGFCPRDFLLRYSINLFLAGNLRILQRIENSDSMERKSKLNWNKNREKKNDSIFHSAPSPTNAGNTASVADNVCQIAHPITHQSKSSEKSREKWIVCDRQYVAPAVATSSYTRRRLCVCDNIPLTHTTSPRALVISTTVIQHSFQQKFPWLLVAIDKIHDTKIPN